MAVHYLTDSYHVCKFDNQLDTGERGEMFTKGFIDSFDVLSHTNELVEVCQ